MQQTAERGHEAADSRVTPTGNSKRLSLQGFSVPRADLSTQQLNAVKKELTVSPAVPKGPGGHAFGSKPVPSFALWKQGASRLYVPKCYGLERFGWRDVRVTLPLGTPCAMRFAGSLRSEQREAVDAFLNAADDPVRMGGILSIPCGGGKTVIALYLAAFFNVKTLIVVHKNFLLEQWKSRIGEFIPGARVGLLKAKTVDVRDKDIVLASLQSLSMKEYDPHVFAEFGFVIIDEVHHTGAEVFSRAFQKVCFRTCLGLSATVKRKDGLSKVFSWYIGSVVYASKTRRDVVHVVQKYFMSRDPEYCEQPQSFGGTLNMSRMINNVTRFRPRTQLIADYVSALLRLNPSRRVLLLSDRLDHLHDLRSEIQQASGGNVSCGMYVGGMKAAELQESEKRAVILATFNFASEGFDVPGLDTLFLTSPKSDIEQSVGRILRQKPTERLNVPLVVDIVDDFSTFQNQGKKRRAFYVKQKYPLRVAAVGVDPDLASAERVVESGSTGAEEDDDDAHHRENDVSDDDFNRTDYAFR